ncbi:hypothetical protein ACUR5C_00515 [Aliikangiella sp. IMCC44653]
MKRWFSWKLNLILGLVVVAGFEVIDLSREQLADVPTYYDFLTTAKWLLVAGFGLMALVGWFKK